MARLFVSQERIDRWSGEGKVTIEGEVMHLPALGRSFRLRPAVHVMRLETDGEDTHRLVGRVKTSEQLVELDAEQMDGSLVIGEISYECEEGFVGEVVGNLGP